MTLHTITEKDMLRELNRTKGGPKPPLMVKASEIAKLPMPPERDWLNVSSAYRPSVKRVFHVVSAITGVAPEEMVSDRRWPKQVLARQIFCWAAIKLTGRSLPYVGSFVRRDHTTVLHACRKVEALHAAGNPTTAAVLAALQKPQP